MCQIAWILYILRAQVCSASSRNMYDMPQRQPQRSLETLHLKWLEALFCSQIRHKRSLRRRWNRLTNHVWCVLCTRGHKVFGSTYVIIQLARRIFYSFAQRGSEYIVVED